MPASAYRLPDPSTRWRCGHCGNLTRFDVIRSSRVREYWHVAMSGEPVVEATEVQQEVVERVVCRWCSADDRIELVPRPDESDSPSDPDGEPGLGGTP